MAYYDQAQNKIVYTQPTPIEGHPNWLRIDCGCCAGIQWGGEYPRECTECGGDGSIAKHIPTGLLAQYPGGPFVGRE